MRLRVATESDAPFIGEILAHAGDPISALAFGPQAATAIETLTRSDIHQPGVVTHVATAEGRVVGVAVVADAHRHLGDLDLRGTLGRPRALWASLVVRVAAQAGLAPGEAYLESLAVSPAWQRQGVARSLLTSAVGEAARRGSVELTFWVAARNAAGLSFFEGFGCEPSRERRWIVLPGPPWAFRMLRFRIGLEAAEGDTPSARALPRANG